MSDGRHLREPPSIVDSESGYLATNEEDIVVLDKLGECIASQFLINL